MNERKRRGGRSPPGTVVHTRDGRLQPMVTLADRTRKRLKPLPRGTSQAMARERAACHAQLAATIDPRKPKTEATPEIPDTPMGRWFKAWLADRVARAYSSTRDNTMHYLLHIAPSIGAKHVRESMRSDSTNLRRGRDSNRRSGSARKAASPNASNFVARKDRGSSPRGSPRDVY